MHNASHPKAGGDNYDRLVNASPDTGDSLAGGASVGTGSFSTTENWSSWSGNVDSAFDSNPSPEDMDNTAYGRIDIPV